MWTTQAYVTGNSILIEDEALRDFDGQQITVSVILPKNQKRSIDDFLTMAKRLNLHSDGQKWTREELHER